MSAWVRWVGISAFVGAAVAGASSGCTSERSPEEECKEFLALTEECYAKGGRQIGTNPIACDQEGALTPQLQAQIKCSLQHSDAYCSTIARSASGDAAGFDPRSPEVVKYSACLSASQTVSPCKEAIQTMAECGAQFAFGPDCTGQSAGLASCILQHRDGACSLYRPREASALTADEQAFQKCQSEAARSSLDASGN